MNRRLLLFVFAVAVIIIGVMPAAAQGVILPPPGGGVFTDPSWLKVDYHRVQVDIENQIATTNVDMKFVNEGEALAEGTFVFPLPEGAAVDQLIMYVDGVAIEAKILPADEARGIYDAIVRQYRDPALLEYIGQGAIQANIFPIPPGDSRRIQISYSQVLEVDNGLIHYIYPLHAAANTGRVVQEMSISVNVESNDPISSIYSPSHPIAIVRGEDDKSFRAGYEEVFFTPGEDFSLYYGIASDEISVNLLTYRESANEDGFFMLLVQPPLKVPQEYIVPKDVIIVLDQSGSMQGVKWDQARDAATYVLENLNPDDRFNVVVFSTGVRVYSDQIEDASLADDAVDWIRGLRAEGGTNINESMLTALDMAHAERPTTIMFLTDGVATEGEIETDKIMDNLREAAGSNVRIFTFGVGDDIDTFLLDTMVQEFRGTGTYVRPSERIDEKVASLYNKISAPVLTDLELEFDDVRVELVYPDTLPDLFAGEQLTVVGRYRDGADNVDITLSGKVSGDSQSYSYVNLEFRDRAGGEPFIARLWATRRIGDLLNTIRLRGENKELVDSIVDLSVRYGIITPYTSFLIEEDDILTQQGRERAADEFAQGQAQQLNTNVTGAAAVDNAVNLQGLNEAEAPMPLAMPTMTAPMDGLGGGVGGGPGSLPPQDPSDDRDQGGEGFGYIQNAINNIGGKTFVNIDGVWNDTAYDPDHMETVKIEFLSDDYFDLLEEYPELGQYLAQGENVIVVWEGVAYEITSAA